MSLEAGPQYKGLQVIIAPAGSIKANIYPLIRTGAKCVYKPLCGEDRELSPVYIDREKLNVL